MTVLAVEREFSKLERFIECSFHLTITHHHGVTAFPSFPGAEFICRSELDFTAVHEMNSVRSPKLQNELLSPQEGLKVSALHVRGGGLPQLLVPHFLLRHLHLVLPI